MIRLAVWQTSSRMPIVLEVGVPWPSSGTLKSGVSALWTLRSAGLLMIASILVILDNYLA